MAKKRNKYDFVSGYWDDTIGDITSDKKKVAHHIADSIKYLLQDIGINPLCEQDLKDFESSLRKSFEQILDYFD